MDLTELDELSFDDLIKLDEIEQAFTQGESTYNPQPSTSTDGNPQRFSNPLTESEFEATLKSRIPKNTQNSSSWALAVFKEWRTWRNYREETKKDINWPIPSLNTVDYKSLDYWLARFITEIRKQDNTDYPPGMYSMYNRNDLFKKECGSNVSLMSPWSVNISCKK